MVSSVLGRTFAGRAAAAPTAPRDGSNGAAGGTDGGRLPVVPVSSPALRFSYGRITLRPIGTSTMLYGSSVVSAYSGTPWYVPTRTIANPSKNTVGPVG